MIGAFLLASVARANLCAGALRAFDSSVVPKVRLERDVFGPNRPVERITHDGRDVAVLFDVNAARRGGLTALFARYVPDLSLNEIFVREIEARVATDELAGHLPELPSLTLAELNWVTKLGGSRTFTRDGRPAGVVSLVSNDLTETPPASRIPTVALTPSRAPWTGVWFALPTLGRPRYVSWDVEDRASPIDANGEVRLHDVPFARQLEAVGFARFESSGATTIFMPSLNVHASGRQALAVGLIYEIRRDVTHGRRTFETYHVTGETFASAGDLLRLSAEFNRRYHRDHPTEFRVSPTVRIYASETLTVTGPDRFLREEQVLERLKRLIDSPKGKALKTLARGQTRVIRIDRSAKALGCTMMIRRATSGELYLDGLVEPILYRSDRAVGELGRG